jgi:hypothetical protein
VQLRHPDLEEFIQVARDDREIAQALEEGDRPVLRLRQDALVERDDAHLPMEEPGLYRAGLCGNGVLFMRSV